MTNIMSLMGQSYKNEVSGRQAPDHTGHGDGIRILFYMEQEATGAS